MSVRFLLLLLMVIAPGLAQADCWRAPNGQIFQTQSNSSPPVYGAQRVNCPSVQAPSCPENSAFDGRGCRCSAGFVSTSSGCVRATAKPVPNQNPRQSGDVCAPYYGKGYCTDWISQRMSNRPRGDPNTWPVNGNLSTIRDGVAVVFGGLSSSGHVAYVERVNRDASGKPLSLDISEMNYGRGLKPSTPPSCLVTSAFGAVGRRTISVYGAGITGFWPI